MGKSVSKSVMEEEEKIWIQVRVHDERFRQDERTMNSTKFDRSGFSAGNLIPVVKKRWDKGVIDVFGGKVVFTLFLSDSWVVFVCFIEPFSGFF